jgi:two-component system sensor histidine kinase MprB
VVVRDDGPGIAASDLPFVFDRFYRSSTARGRPGSGLGLAIVRQIAELHGGVATAASTERGAVLRVSLSPTSDPAGSTSPSTQNEAGLRSVEPDQRREVLGDRPDIA